MLLDWPAASAPFVALGDLVGAFDNKNQPGAELRARTPGRWTFLLGRTGDTLERYSRIGAAVWAIFSLIVATILILAFDGCTACARRPSAGIPAGTAGRMAVLPAAFHHLEQDTRRCDLLRSVFLMVGEQSRRTTSDGWITSRS